MEGETYFGVIPSCLDIFTLSYRWFGCVWILRNSAQIIEGYWFADVRDEIKRKAETETRFGCLQRASDVEVQQMYVKIRRRQAQKDWETRSRLPFKTMRTPPWHHAQVGWYILRSREEFPYYVSAIRKRKWFAWIEHIAVCDEYPGPATVYIPSE